MPFLVDLHWIPRCLRNYSIRLDLPRIEDDRKVTLYREGMKRSASSFRTWASSLPSRAFILCRRPLSIPLRTLSPRYVQRVAFQRKRQALRLRILRSPL